MKEVIINVKIYRLDYGYLLVNVLKEWSLIKRADCDKYYRELQGES